MERVRRSIYRLLGAVVHCRIRGDTSARGIILFCDCLSRGNLCDGQCLEATSSCSARHEAQGSAVTRTWKRLLLAIATTTSHSRRRHEPTCTSNERLAAVVIHRVCKRPHAKGVSSGHSPTPNVRRSCAHWPANVLPVYSSFTIETFSAIAADIEYRDTGS